jgi:hypothetical protein
LAEREKQRNDIDKLKATITAPPHTRLTDSHATITHTSLEEKNKKELQHLDSTIIVWKKTLADAEAKKDMTRERKEQVDLRIAHVEKQIKELKEAKKPKIKSSSAATPPTKQPTATPIQPANPIIVPSAVRRIRPEQEHFPALGAAIAPASTLRGDAPTFSSMRIKPQTGGTVAQAPAPRNTAVSNSAGSRKGYGGGPGQHGGQGGWGD